jgi:nitrile hydratase
MSYYERFVAALETLLLKAGVVNPEELASGKPAPGSLKATPALPASKVAAMMDEDDTSRLNVAVDPRFKVGQQVRARTMNPAGHTRLPRYARGKTGTIVRDEGVFALQDSDAAGLMSSKPQRVYSVRFTARELWGDEASPHDAVYVDMWDDYLEHA